MTDKISDNTVDNATGNSTNDSNKPSNKEADSTSQPMIKVEQLSVKVGRKQLVSDINFEIKPNSITGLVGENGAGKSTLIKSILDFSSPSAGTVTINGQPHNQKQSRHVLAYLPERFSPPHYLNGLEYLTYCAKLYGVDCPPVPDMAEQLALPEEAFTRPVKTLSKGMVQKLGLLATLNSQRPLLLLDEPMSGLDPRARFLLRTRLEQLQKQQGTTILFTTHMLNDIQELADHMLLMHGGALKYSGPPSTLIQETDSDSLEAAFLRKTA